MSQSYITNIGLGRINQKSLKTHNELKTSAIGKEDYKRMENEIASAKRPLNIIGEEAVRAVKNNRDSVGIITYSDSLNWGAQLQAFALKEAIQNNGFDAYQIDHRRMNLSQYRKGRNISVIIGNLIAFLKEKVLRFELKER